MIHSYLKSCTGPCLKHCYKDTTRNNIIYLLIGIIIGILTSYFYYKNKEKESNN